MSNSRADDSPRALVFRRQLADFDQVGERSRERYISRRIA
jgi:hypothetical protein